MRELICKTRTPQASGALHSLLTCSRRHQGQRNVPASREPILAQPPFAQRFTQVFLTHSRSTSSHYPGSMRLRRWISPRLEEGCPMLNLVKMQVPQRRKLLGKAHGICVIVQKYPVYFSPM